MKREELELVAQGKAGSLWALRTWRPLATVAASGYFDRFASHGLKPGDRIMVTANATNEAIEPAWATVTRLHEGEVRVAW